MAREILEENKETFVTLLSDMEIEGIYLHGGAKGFSFINDSGTQTEFDSFFKRFYDKITKAAISIQKIESVSKSFVVESLHVNGKQFYDYTFMEHYVYDVSGRPSYFGITIRLSAFYCEVSDLYFILDTIFKKDIIGNLLLPKDSSYMCTKEQIDKPLFEKVMNDIVQLSSSVLQDSNLRGVRSVSGEKGGGVSINLIDCQPQVVEKAISQHGRLTISTGALLQRESQSRQEIDKLNQQWTAKWNDLQGKHTAAINNAQGLNGTIQTLQGQLSQAQNDLTRIQREFNEYKSKNKLNYEVINGLKEEKQALLKLAGFVDSLGIDDYQRIHDRQKTKKVHGNRDKERYEQGEDDNIMHFNLKPYLSYILVIFVLVLIIWLLSSLKDCSGKGFLSFLDDNNTPNTEVVESQPQAPTSDAGITGGTTQQATRETAQQADDYSAVSEGIASENANTQTTDIDFNTLTIDVAEFTKELKYMTKNKAYTIRICDNKKYQPVKGIKGSWKIQDSDFYIGDPNSAVTTITPKRSGNDLLIQFFVVGYGTPLKRTIVVKE